MTGPRGGRVLAIDPDPNGGSWVLFGADQKITCHGWREPIEKLCYFIRDWGVENVVVENLQSYGMSAGASMFDTAKSIGELRGCCRGRALFDDTLTRPYIKAALCKSVRAKDANVRAALIDLYGGDKRAAIGLKASPGPLYGITKDRWAALALAVVWLGMRGLGPLAVRDSVKEGAVK